MRELRVERDKFREDVRRQAEATFEQWLTPGAASVRVEMPSPPSTNQLYSGRRFKTSAYKAWLDDAGWAVKLQQPALMPPGRLRVLIEAPLGPRRDLDNLKAALDLLVGLGIIADDRLIDDFHVVRVPQDRLMTVSIWPM